MALIDRRENNASIYENNLSGRVMAMDNNKCRNWPGVNKYGG
jgi:hypothetical protein